MDTPKIEKAQEFIPAEIIKYVPNGVASHTIYKKPTGSITVLSFDTGIERTERSLPYDTFACVIDGTVEMEINGTSHVLQTGMAIVIPADASNSVKATSRFKMILTVIKSEYEG
jgi:quercetin dioxygenase-like cupin family protein